MAKIIKQIDKIFQISGLTQNLHFNRRVAIYARVSTSKEEQLNSLEAQKDYYTQYIAMRPNFTFVEMYVDEGISGLKKEHRIAFNKMMNDASLKKFDLILTKSISRFARNTVDTLSCIRKLKDYNIEVFFEKENI
jgi:DNA invertase Pin-like site-specific DNA recombinase